MDFFFFKQKTAYEMRISDWSSDVCSSDLGQVGIAGAQPWRDTTIAPHALPQVQHVASGSPRSQPRTNPAMTAPPAPSPLHTPISKLSPPPPSPRPSWHGPANAEQPSDPPLPPPLPSPTPTASHHPEPTA